MSEFNANSEVEKHLNKFYPTLQPKNKWIDKFSAIFSLSVLMFRWSFRAFLNIDRRTFDSFEAVERGGFPLGGRHSTFEPSGICNYLQVMWDIWSDINKTDICQVWT